MGSKGARTLHVCLAHKLSIINDNVNVLPELQKYVSIGLTTIDPSSGDDDPSIQRHSHTWTLHCEPGKLTHNETHMGEHQGAKVRYPGYNTLGISWTDSSIHKHVNGFTIHHGVTLCDLEYCRVKFL